MRVRAIVLRQRVSPSLASCADPTWCVCARAGWEGCGLGVDHTQHYLNGTPATNPKLFPDMKGMVDYGHKKGLKMGWYFNGCGCIEKHKHRIEKQETKNLL